MIYSRLSLTLILILCSCLVPLLQLGLYIFPFIVEAKTDGPDSFFIVFLLALLFSSLSLFFPKRVSYDCSFKQSNKIAKILLILTYIYLTVTWIQFFVNGRQFGIEELVIYRELANIAGAKSSIQNTIPEVLQAAPLLWFCLCLSKKSLKSSLTLSNNEIMILMLTVPTLLFSGGRSPLVMSVLVVSMTLFVSSIFAGFSIPRALSRLSLRRFLTVCLTSIVLFSTATYSVLIDIYRKAYQGLNAEDTFMMTINSYNISPGIATSYISTKNDEIAIGMLMFSQYILQPVLKLNELLMVSELKMSLGLNSFGLLGNIASKLLGLKYDLSQSLVFEGFAYTGFGSLIQDFSLLGASIIIVVFAAYLSKVYSQREVSPISCTLMSLSFLLILAFPLFLVTSTTFFGSAIICWVISSSLTLLSF